MMQIIDETFATRHDPGQLQVTEADMQRLQQLHPATLSEYNEGKGPCVWILLIPTTTELMDKFLAGQLTETGLLWSTEPGSTFDSVYLCSATTLPEYRNKGITTRIALNAIEAIRKEHPVKKLFVWPFTEEGKQLAEKLGTKAGLPVLVRQH